MYLVGQHFRWGVMTFRYSCTCTYSVNRTGRPERFGLVDGGWGVVIWCRELLVVSGCWWRSHLGFAQPRRLISRHVPSSLLFVVSYLACRLTCPGCGKDRTLGRRQRCQWWKSGLGDHQRWCRYRQDPSGIHIHPSWQVSRLQGARGYGHLHNRSRGTASVPRICVR